MESISRHTKVINELNETEAQRMLIRRYDVSDDQIGYRLGWRQGYWFMTMNAQHVVVRDNARIDTHSAGFQKKNLSEKRTGKQARNYSSKYRHEPIVPCRRILTFRSVKIIIIEESHCSRLVTYCIACQNLFSEPCENQIECNTKEFYGKEISRQLPKQFGMSHEFSYFFVTFFWRRNNKNEFKHWFARSQNLFTNKSGWNSANDLFNQVKI